MNNQSVYKAIKKNNGEAFARTLRDFHGWLLEVPDIVEIVRHAGKEAKPLLPYLMTLMPTNDNNKQESKTPADPFQLFARAGYDAFYADTKEKQNSIAGHYAPGELICTISNDTSRFEKYHIIHAVKKDVDDIRRENFTGKEAREDDYGTSVLSVQMLKTGGQIKIISRYNHGVDNPDNTYGCDPDQIIDGLSAALKHKFKVDFTVAASPLPDNCILIGHQIFRHHNEINGIFYGDQAWVKDGKIHTTDRSKETLFDYFIFDNATKTMRAIDPMIEDSFPQDFNRFYKGNKGLIVDKKENLILNGKILIESDQSQIKSLFLPALTSAGNWFMINAGALTHVDLPALTSTGDSFMVNADALTHVDLLALTSAGDGFMENARALTHVDLPELTSAGDGFMVNAPVHLRPDLSQRQRVLSHQALAL